MPPKDIGPPIGIGQVMELRAAIELRIERPENGDAINAMIHETNRREMVGRAIAMNEGVWAGSDNWPGAAEKCIAFADALLAELGRGGGT